LKTTRAILSIEDILFGPLPRLYDTILIYPLNVELYCMPYYHMYPFMGFGTGILWLVAIVVIAYLIYKLVKSEKILLPSRIVSSKNVEDILDERYAKGELTREQYMQIKEDIKKPT
jgi:putative membrane protein